ncbi:M48 family metallopeptidase [Shewanella sp. GutDb-MelDb]|uniref:M48 family metallopeptidase n=1 Tax=Shewanella sp. GutDb-MelDb TaxID=2058316 RepID=UPI000C7DAEB7|nr:M48 family metallopeptidase [Shewanella sp. GutDb-MelDb]PKG55054.1 Zn-dependent protease [Shewanella sp. GutDb-MelDb]
MKGLLLIVSALLLISGCATHHSPTGRNQTLLFSAQEMSQLGDSSFVELKKTEKISDDIQLNRFVDCVAARITRALPEQGQRWEVIVFDSKQVNAFALPGRHIGVYTGLLNVAINEDQLATVISHEVAHVLANHSNEQVSRAKMTGIGMQFADLALDVGGVSNQEGYMAALDLGIQVGYMLPYGREQESEADIMGVQLMASAGFNPAESVALWRNMAKAGGEQGPELLSTHPSYGQRIESLQEMQAKAQHLYEANRVSVKDTCQRPK